MTTLIARNTTIPTERSEIFTTSLDNQSYVPVHVLQGERPMAVDCRSLGRFELTGIPPAPRGIPKIQVLFRIDENGLVTVEAKDLGTGRKQEIKIRPTSGLSQEDVDRLIQESFAFEKSDVERRELAYLRNQAQALLYATEEALSGYADLVDAALLSEVKRGCEELKTRLDEHAELSTLKEAQAKLEEVSFRIAESLYGEAGTLDAAADAKPA